MGRKLLASDERGTETIEIASRYKKNADFFIVGATFTGNGSLIV